MCRKIFRFRNLPLSHALARHQDYAFSAIGAQIAYLSKFDDLSKGMKIIRPTIFVAVPRVFEKVRQAVKAGRMGFAKKISYGRWDRERSRKT